MTDTFDFTRHASVRQQQRCIPPLIVDWLVRYGSRQQAASGASILFFDKVSRRRLAQDVGAPVLDALDSMLDAFLVQAADDAIITVGWRTKRVLRNRKTAGTKPVDHFPPNRH